MCVFDCHLFSFFCAKRHFSRAHLCFKIGTLSGWIWRCLRLAVGLQVCNVYKFHLSCSTRPPPLIEMVLKKWHADSFSRDDIDRYVLKVAGREEYLVSDDKMLRQYIVRVE